MAGDLLLTNLDEGDLSVLLGAGGTMGTTIFHADRFGQPYWDIWGQRLEAGLGGARNQNRAGLPPHFYISFRGADLKLKQPYDLAFAKVIGAAVRPLTIVSAHAGLNGWSSKLSNSALVEIFRNALGTGNVTLEIYNYDGDDLIGRGDGVKHGSLGYLASADE